jgi:hypothetical protein
MGTLRRYSHDTLQVIASENLGFPPPVYLGRFRYWKIADLLAWEASRPSVGAPAGAARRRAMAEAV